MVYIRYCEVKDIAVNKIGIYWVIKFFYEIFSLLWKIVIDYNYKYDNC